MYENLLANESLARSDLDPQLLERPTSQAGNMDLRDAHLSRDPGLAHAREVGEVQEPSLALVESTEASGQERAVLPCFVTALGRRLHLQPHPFAVAVPILGE